MSVKRKRETNGTFILYDVYMAAFEPKFTEKLWFLLSISIPSKSASFLKSMNKNGHFFPTVQFIKYSKFYILLLMQGISKVNEAVFPFLYEYMKINLSEALNATWSLEIDINRLRRYGALEFRQSVTQGKHSVKRSLYIALHKRLNLVLRRWNFYQFHVTCTNAEC